jgi:UDP-2,4-diacetamido-2,4,6-trideoxy-beta-L-altropyranose hydrolase
VAKQVFIRADASEQIGTGHVMRCLTLAELLRERGNQVHFICRDHVGNISYLIEARGFSVARLPRYTSIGESGETQAEGALGAPWHVDAEESRAAIEAVGLEVKLLVVDHYSIDCNWESTLRPHVARILVLDDLADRRHDCDVLLDQGLHDSPASRYAGLVREDAQVFVGPRYALLRPEFGRVAPRLRDSGLGHLLVYLGGADQPGETLKIVHGLRALENGCPPTQIVLGPANCRSAAIRLAAGDMPAIQVIEVTNEMASLMVRADLAVGTCGGAAWERCAVGLPSLVVINAENQRDDARLLDSLGAVRNLGDASAMSPEGWRAAIAAIRDEPQDLLSMSRVSLAVMHGHEQAIKQLVSAVAP